MDRSYPYSRRLVSRARLRKRMAAVAAAGLAGAAALFLLAWKPDPIAAAMPAPTLPVLADGMDFSQAGPQGPRRIYPYSVVPGGVSGQVELARVIRVDRVVAAHYASFDVDKARAVVVEKPRAVHVSYRKGDKVYWTARKVMLAPGETLLSDGRNEMRARCANRISDVPRYPVEAHQPAMEELDQPVDVDEGEQYALGPDGLPVSMSGDGGMPRQPGQRFPVRGGSGGVATGAPADATLALNSFSAGATDTGTLTAMNMSAASSSMGSRPRPAGRPAATPETPAGSDSGEASGENSSGSGSSGSNGGTSSSPAPSGGGTTPTAQPGSETPVTTTPTPLPSTDPAPPTGSPAAGPQPGTPGTSSPSPAPVPGTGLPPVSMPGQGGQTGGGSPGEPEAAPPAPGPLAPQPEIVTEPFIPKPDLGPTPPRTDIEQPAPPTVPEPGSIWLVGAALAALAALRRSRRKA